MEYDYIWEDWRVDWAATLEATATKSEESSREYFVQLFQSRYTNPVEANWKRARIGAAYDYLICNLDALENAGWILRSSKGIDVFPHLSIALYRFFSVAPDAALSSSPPPEVIIAVAEEQRRLNGP
jgi:hypothetical protein